MLFSLSFPEKLIRTAKLTKKPTNAHLNSQRANRSTEQQVFLGGSAGSDRSDKPSVLDRNTQFNPFLSNYYPRIFDGIKATYQKSEFHLGKCCSPVGGIENNTYICAK